MRGSRSKRALAGAARSAGDAEETDGRRLRRLRTEEKLVAAVGQLLREGGVATLGVNALAERAGVEKVLVYRYFGGLEGLMEAYAARSDFWPTLEELVGPEHEVLRDPDKATAGARILANYAAALRRRPVTLDLLGWECAHRNPLVVALENVREARSRELARAMAEAGVPLDGGLAELGMLIAAATNYLAVRGRQLRVFGGLAIRTDADWAHIDDVVQRVFRTLVASRAAPPRGRRATRGL